MHIVISENGKLCSVLYAAWNHRCNALLNSLTIRLKRREELLDWNAGKEGVLDWNVSEKELLDCMQGKRDYKRNVREENFLLDWKAMKEGVLDLNCKSRLKCKRRGTLQSCWK